MASNNIFYTIFVTAQIQYVIEGLSNLVTAEVGLSAAYWAAAHGKEHKRLLGASID